MDTLPSKRIGIVTANHTGYVETVFSCLEDGSVVVPLREPNDVERIEAARVDQVVMTAAGGTWMRKKLNLPKSNDVAVIAFTSGTEGKPKGVILTYGNLVDVDQRLNALMQLDDSVSEYVGVPVYHSFGFGRCRAVSMAGGKFFIPENGFNPAEIGLMLKRREINAISAVPSLWRILLANKDLIGSYGKHVRWIEIGSQYMSRPEKEALKALFPEAKIVQHYGLTEASRTTLLEIHHAEGEVLESVGQALDGVEVKLTQEGRIAVRGQHVARGYLINGQEVALQDKDGWFLTSDLGKLEQDYLYYRGRADDVINCGGIKVHPETLEAKIYATVGFSHGLAICGKSDAIRGEGFLVAVTKDVDLDRQQLREAVWRATCDLGVNAANAVTIIDVDSLPTTATGKVQRKKLSEWYALQSPEDDQTALENADTSSPIQGIFCRNLNLNQVNSQDTFISLGGDSLTYVQLSMQLERYLGYLPQGWESLSIEQIEQLQPQSQRTSSIETNVFLRAIAICGVVFNHTGLIPGNYIGGGSILLLIIAGLNFARFKESALFKNQILESTKPLLMNLVIPYLIISIAYQFWKHKIDILTLLMLDDFVHFRQVDLIVFPFPVWFINILVQCIVVFIVFLSIRPVNKFASSFPHKFGLATLGVTALVSAISMSFLYPYEINQFPRLPHVLFWLFILGWCIHFAQSRTQKLEVTVALLISVFLDIAVHSKVNSEHFWILLGGATLIWVPFIVVPSIVKPTLQIIAAAAYYVFLTHMIFLHFTMIVAGIDNLLLNAVLAILGGVIVWDMLQKLQQAKWLKSILKIRLSHSLID